MSTYPIESELEISPDEHSCFDALVRWELELDSEGYALASFINCRPKSETCPMAQAYDTFSALKESAVEFSFADAWLSEFEAHVNDEFRKQESSLITRAIKDLEEGKIHDIAEAKRERMREGL